MNNLMRLCIVPCGSAKIWDKNPEAGPQKAQDIYTGVFAVACQKYAKAFFDHWVILSAKHGFLFPDDIVNESYNVSFIKPSNETIELQDLKDQAKEKGLYHYQEITVLGGKHYVDRAKAIFNREQSILLPLSECKGIGYMLQKLSNALEATTPIRYKCNNSASQTHFRNESIAPVTGKYAPLYNYLLTRQESPLTLTVDQLEALLGFSLPSSSTKHQAWWSNDITHSQAKAWLYAGWEVKHVSLPEITFRRNQED